MENQKIFEVIKSARTIQKFLWGQYDLKWNIEEWRRMFRKRIKKIDDISSDNPHAMIELKKRLLQNAALCIALLDIIESSGIPGNECDVPSNLEEYKGE